MVFPTGGSRGTKGRPAICCGSRPFAVLKRGEVIIVKGKRRVFIVVWLGLAAVFLIGGLLLSPPTGSEESIQETMRDAVLHESNQISLLGLRPVNPALISGLVVTAVLLLAAAVIRIFVIPRFKYVPGKFQLLLEQAVGLFDGLAKSNSPWRNGFLGAYVFAAGPTSSLAPCSSS